MLKRILRVELQTASDGVGHQKDRWLTPVILATREVEIKRITV
jgi:hypothetical protein